MGSRSARDTTVNGFVQLAFASALVAAMLAAGPVVAEPRVVLEFKGGMRAGPASPAFALYGDGLVIFGAPYESSAASGYLSTRLAEPQYQALLSRVAPEALLKLHDDYDVVTGTDPVASVIHVWVGGRRKTVTVVGHLNRIEGKGRSKAPAAFVRAYDAMTNFSASAQPWLPPSIEVMLWPREHFPEKVVPWPKGWPSPEGARHSLSEMRRIMLPATEFNRLKGLLPEGNNHQTVNIRNQRWMMSYRLPFPHELTWARD